MMDLNNLRFLRRLRFAGFKDNISLLGLAISGLVLSPTISDIASTSIQVGVSNALDELMLHPEDRAACSLPLCEHWQEVADGMVRVLGEHALSVAQLIDNVGGAPFVSFACASAAAVMITKRMQQTIGAPAFETETGINSDDPPISPDRQSDPKRSTLRWDGILLGYCTDTGEPLIIDWENWMRHCFILGQSGVGKTVLGEWVMNQQIAQGGGLLFIDGKLDEANLKKLHAMCCWAGRRQDLLVINPGDPDNSNSYNPILDGDPDEIAARVLSLIPSSEGNAGTDYYRQAANQGVTTLVGAIQRAGKAYNFLDISILLQNQKALQYLESIVPGGSEEAKQLMLFLEQYKVVTKDGATQIDLKRLKETFGGVGGRMHMFGSGNFGKVTKSYAPEVNLFEAMKGNKIVYVALPTMGKAEAASNFGKMVVGDFRTAISKVQALPKNERPWPPFCGFFDEAGSYVQDSWSRIFEQARAAHLAMCPAVQTIANLDSVSEELREMVIGNTWTKCFFKIGTNESAEIASELIGEEARSALSVSSSGGEGVSSTAGTGQKTGTAQNDSNGFTEREENVAKVSTDALKALGKGEAIVTYGGSRVYHIKIPMLDFSPDFLEEIGPFELNRSNDRFVNGLNLFKDPNRWLSGNRNDY